MNNSNELKQLRQLAEYLRSAWYHGEWKAETPNEESMEKIMTELGYWPITDEWFWGNKTIGEPNPEDEWVVDEWGNRFKKSLFESFYDQPSTQFHGGEMNMSNNNPGTTTTTTNNMTTNNNNTVTTGQNNTGTYPEPKQIWQHYKGGRYEIIAMCNHTTTNEPLVIYKSLSFNGFYARPYSEWHDEVWVENHRKTRFELVSWGF